MSAASGRSSSPDGTPSGARVQSPVTCANPDHARPVTAIAALTYPDGRFNPVTACKSDLLWLVRQALDYGTAVLVSPVVPDE